jgi:hypothetical protein
LTLKELVNENRLLDANTTQKLDDIKSRLINQMKSEDADVFAGLPEYLKALAEEGETVRKQQKILRSLRFPSIKVRYEAIKPAYAETFKWVFRNDKSTFVNWLGSGSGIYWIQGKAGSGKSTLLRYLAEHEETRAVLEYWAGGCRLFTGSHFFWNAGNSIQKSQEGLLRTLLYQVFRQCPDLVESACSFRWNDEESDTDSWSRDHLFATLHELGKRSLSSARFCFFIDGLDEYSGKHQDLILLLNTLSKSPSIKICVSSRPWNVFVQAFGAHGQELKLEDLTRDDIREYVQRRFEESAKFRQLRSKSFASSKIIDDIVERARGVFLWVSLVVEALLHGLIEGDDVLEMRRRLDSLPIDLEKYFEHMIGTIEPFYRDETIRWFEIAVNALQPLPILAYHFLEQEKENEDYALHKQVQALSNREITSIYETTKVRLNARCKDLLEVRDYSSETSLAMCRYKVDFLHRTVRDFLLGTRTIEELRQGKLAIDPHISLCRIMLALTKALPSQGELTPALNEIFSFVDEFMYHSREVELHCHESEHGNGHLSELQLLDEFDRVMIEHTGEETVHWTNLRDIPKGKFGEYKHKTFLASAIQAGLTLYVRQKLDVQTLQAKRGRPLLDYALRPHIVTPIELPDHEARPDIEMVRSILEKGADPNQKVYIYAEETIWSLFLHQYKGRVRTSKSGDESREFYTVAEMLIQAGANPDPNVIGNTLREFLRASEVASLEELMAEKRQRPWGMWDLLAFLGLN